MFCSKKPGQTLPNEWKAAIYHGQSNGPWMHLVFQNSTKGLIWWKKNRVVLNLVTNLQTMEQESQGPTPSNVKTKWSRAKWSDLQHSSERNEILLKKVQYSREDQPKIQWYPSGKECTGHLSRRLAILVRELNFQWLSPDTERLISGLEAIEYMIIRTKQSEPPETSDALDLQDLKIG